MERPWHALPAGQAVAGLRTDSRQGLSEGEARRRLARTGPNRLPHPEGPGLLALFVKEFQDFMVLILLAATAVSAALGEWHDAAAILVIVLLNALLGFVQEQRAERSLRALRELAAPGARVLRGGRMREVRAESLVPGDLVVLESGDRVPADARLLEGYALEVDESALTGESVPAAKRADWRGRGPESPGDRLNMVFLGTAVTRGWGRAVVVATGLETQVGHIAHLLRSVRPPKTPLQRRLERLGKGLVAACLGLVGLVVLLGLWQGIPAYRMFLTGVSLAVAAIPEGLPAVVTVSLALGVQRMLRRRAVVRRLPVVETLGCATVICSDKTGTLTRNEMTVTRLWLAGREIRVTGSGYRPEGRFRQGGVVLDPAADPDLQAALRICVLCNHARLWRDRGGWRIAGDPTEAALMVAACKGGLDPAGLQRQHPPIHEVPFDPDRRRMTVAAGRGEEARAFCKGAPDAVLACCERVQAGGRERPLSPEDRRRILRAADELAGQALRVLGLAWGPARAAEGEQGLTFVGLAAMHDPPRPEVRGALEQAGRAGIRTVMVTGDHRQTAASVARELGLLPPGGEVLTGEDLDRLPDRALEEKVRQVRVFARVSPRQKLRIVQALRRQGEVVAMTGDGVNDAPALREADIGVAMGRTGTDVTREAAAMVLADDNYATIVAAVEEGRGIYENIRKFIRYLLGCNVGEVLTMLLAVLAGMPLPLLPMQLLWMNLVTDGLPAVALGVDPPARGIMERPPRRPGEGIFAGGLAWRILYRGLLIGTCGLVAFGLSLALLGTPLPQARSVAFSALVLAQLVYVYQCRGPGAGRNPYLAGAVALSLAMQAAVLYLPLLRSLFGTVPLGAGDWLVALAAAAGSALLDGAARTLRFGTRRSESLAGA